MKFDAEGAADAFAVLSSVPGWSVDSPSFYLTRETEEELSLKLRAEAIKDSKKTAKVLAEAAGLKIVGVEFLGERKETRPERAGGDEALICRL